MRVRALADRLRSEPSVPLAELAGLRAAAYELLGSLFYYPEPDDLDGLRASADGIGRRTALARGFSFYPRLRLLLERLERPGDGEFEALEQEYVDLFVVGASSAACPPYESAYVERQGPQRGLVCVSVERAYAAAGFTLDESGELPDHAALELGFLSVLCSEELRRWRGGDADAAFDCLERQEEFHERHLGRWFTTFTRRLGSVTAPTSLYRTLAGAAHAFVAHDRELVHALVQDRVAPFVRLTGSAP